MDEEKEPAFDSRLSSYIEADFVGKTTLAELPNVGRVVIAAQNFEVGNVILREEPVLVWSTGKIIEYAEKFHSLSWRDQAGILDMFHPPLEQVSDMISSMMGPTGDFPEQLEKIVAIALVNAHDYHGQVGNGDSGESTEPEHNSKLSGLFLYASKMVHSCRPNVSYTSKTNDGKLEYKAIRPIRKGDMVTFSYIDLLLQTTTRARRESLIKSKGFWCKCERCIAPDYSRSFPCPDCNYLVPRCPIEFVQEHPWYCRICDKPLDEQRLLSVEDALAKQVLTFQKDMEDNFVSKRPNPALELVTRSVVSLGRLHFVTLRIMELYVKLCASHASHLESYGAVLPPPMITQMTNAVGSPRCNRERAGLMGLELISSCECINAGCTQKVCHETHAPSYDTVATVFYTARDFAKAGWTAEATNRVRSYLPLMRIMWGDDDQDIARIEESLLGATSGTTTSGVDSAATPQTQKPRSSGKKKNGRKQNNKKKGKK